MRTKIVLELNFTNTATIFFGLNIVFGVSIFSKIQSKPLQFYFCFQIIQFLVDIFLIYLVKNDNSTQVRILYGLLKMVDYVLLINIFFNYDQLSVVKKISFLISIIFLIISVGNIIYEIDNLYTFQNTQLIYGVMIIIICLIYFLELTYSDEIIELSKLPQFWIACGLLLFYSINIFSSGFYLRMLQYSKVIAYNLYYLNYGMGLILYLLFSYAYYLDTKRYV